MGASIPESIWLYGLVVIPLALVVTLLCRVVPCRPSTRHSMWLSLLVLLLVAPFLPKSPAPDLGQYLDEASIALAMEDPTVSDTETTDTTETTDDVAAQADVTVPEYTLDPDAANDSATPARSNRIASRESEPRWNPQFDHPKPLPPVTEWTHRSDPSWPVSVQSPVASSMRERLNDNASFGSGSGFSTDDVRTSDDRRSSSWPASGNQNTQTSLETRQTQVDGVTPIADSTPALAGSDPSPIVSPDSQTSRQTGNDDSAAASTSEPASSEIGPWVQWQVFVKTVRDAVISIPSIPLSVWAGGALLFMLITLLRMYRFRRLLHRTMPASELTEELVTRTAQSMGLRRIPTTLMVADRVSPMVSCSFQVTLLLPKGLWAHLDDQGREAVVAHELAHLRRRDHWVCWIELVVQFVYWWHPLVWFLRRRLSEEADLSCDAWVTSLLPRSRRQYASALLETKSFTSAAYKGLPVMALNVSSTHAKRFARRITMVMSHQTRPRLNVGGVALAATIVAAGWLATPTIACDHEKMKAQVEAARTAALTCPPKDKEADKAKAEKKERERIAARERAEQQRVIAAERRAQSQAERARQQAERALEAARRQSDSARRPGMNTQDAAADEGDGSTFEDFMRNRDNASLEDRVRQLEEELMRLREQLNRLAPRGGVSFAPGEWDVLATTMPNVQLYADAARQFAIAVPSDDCDQCTSSSAVNIIGQHAPAAVQSIGINGAVTSRRYTLSEGKLDALTELMARSDVPVLISPGEGYIEVQASEPQHQVFSAFCMMIGSEKESWRDHSIDGGKREALTDLMARSDVPIYIRSGSDKIEVEGTELEQAIFDAFIKTILNAPVQTTRFPVAPPAPRIISVPENVMQYDRAAQRELNSVINEHRVRYENMLGQLSGEAHEHEAELEALRHAHHEILQQLRHHEHEMTGAHRMAERLEQRADSMRERIDEVLGGIDELNGSARERAESRMQSMMEQLQALESEHVAIADHGHVMEDEAHALEGEAEHIEWRIGEIETVLEALGEQTEFAIEELEVMLQEALESVEVEVGDAVEQILMEMEEEMDEMESMEDMDEDEDVDFEWGADNDNDEDEDHDENNEVL